jgi:triosephosphate isomerase
MRKKIVAGNWKMNLLHKEALQLVSSLNEQEISSDVIRIVFPPFIYISELRKQSQNVFVGAQNFYPKESGAYTGEVSINQLKDLGVEYVLVGHSERRMYFNESDEFLKEKVDAAIRLGIHVIFCCGESLEIRDANTHESFVINQLNSSLFHLSSEELKNITIAYEPIWAIGTGRTASSQQAEEMHACIRKSIEDKYSQEVADSISILYGGSCNASNANEMFACPNVDGGLIGGASLKAQDFYAISTAY